jgi:DNA-directed RNA polymerase specialized sigma24 family protein
MDNNLTRGDAEFPKTDANLLRMAAKDRQALTQFLVDYRPKLRQIIRHQYRITSNETDDVLQDFFLKKVLNGRLLESYSPEGNTKFRTYIKQALRNHIIDHFRQMGRKGQGQGLEPDDMRFVDVREVSPDLLIDYGWARNVLGRGLRRMKRSCESSKRREAWWPIVKFRLVMPALGRRDRITYAELVRRCNLKSPKQAHEINLRAMEHYKQCLLETVREYVDESEITEELFDLQSLFETGLNFADLWRSLAHGRRARDDRFTS